MNRRELYAAYGAWLLVCLIWGTTYLAIRIAVQHFPPALMSGVRFITAGGLMSLFFLLRGEKFPPFSQWKHLAIVGVALIGIGNWFVVWAEKTVPSGPAALMVAITPFWMAILESRISTTRFWDTRKVLGLVTGFAGVVLLVLPELGGDWKNGYLWGIIALQIATLSWAAGSLYSKYKKVDANPLVNASLQMLIGGVFLTIIGLMKGEIHEFHYDGAAMFSLVYLAVVGAMIGYVCYIYALEKLPSSTVSLYAYINPVIAVWLGWLVLKEKVTVITVIATVVILTGVWLVKSEGKKLKEINSFEQPAKKLA